MGGGGGDIMKMFLSIKHVYQGIFNDLLLGKIA